MTIIIIFLCCILLGVAYLVFAQMKMSAETLQCLKELSFLQTELKQFYAVTSAIRKFQGDEFEKLANDNKVIVSYLEYLKQSLQARL